MPLIRYTEPACIFTSCVTSTFPDTTSSLSMSTFPITFKFSKFPTVFRLLYITELPIVVFDKICAFPIVIILPLVILIPKTFILPLIEPPELLDLLSSSACKFWISAIVRIELVIWELSHFNIPLLKLLICISKTVECSGAFNTQPVPKLFTVINPWLSISLSLIYIPLPLAVPFPAEPLFSVIVLSETSKILDWI